MMTNKEAIFELIKYRRRLEKDSTIDAEPFDMAIEALKEQKMGKWYEDEEVGLCRCDQCQAVNLIHTPFCPMCGARMVGEEEWKSNSIADTRE